MYVSVSLSVYNVMSEPVPPPVRADNIYMTNVYEYRRINKRVFPPTYTTTAFYFLPAPADAVYAGRRPRPTTTLKSSGGA